MNRPTRELTKEEEAAIETMYQRKEAFEPPNGYVTTTAPIPMGSNDEMGPWGENPNRIIPAGATLKIVMVSRMGDAGLIDKLDIERGYEVRLSWDDAAMSNIRLTP